MNRISSYKYQINDLKRPVAIYYFVIACLYALTFFGAVMTTHIDTGSDVYVTSSSGISGWEIGTAIFLFVCGLNSFREPFRMLIQNGSSRKNIFAGRFLAFLSVGAGMALIDTLIMTVGQLLTSGSKRWYFKGFYEIAFSRRAESISGVQMHLESFFLIFCMYMAALAVGYFITIGYYRMNKAAKIAVSISVPGFLFYGLPILDQYVTKGAIFRAIGKVFAFFFGMDDKIPYYPMAFGLLTAAVFLGLCWLMLRKAVVKD